MISLAVIVILVFSKINFLATWERLERQYFNNRRCEIVKKKFVQQIHVFHLDELKKMLIIQTNVSFTHVFEILKKDFSLFLAESDET